MAVGVTEMHMNIAEPGKGVTTKRLLAVVFLIKIIGVAFATLVFSKFTPLVDSQLYLEEFYKTDAAFRTQAVQWLTTILNNISGPYFTHFTFALISTLGLTYYYLTGGRRWVLALTLLLPSSLVWTSIVGKEAIFCGAMGLGLVVWSKYAVKSLGWQDVVVATLAIGVCASLRPHYAVALLWLFVATIILKRLGSKAWPLLMCLLLVGALATYFWVWQDLLYRGYGGIEPNARASRFHTLGIAAGTDQGFEQFKSMLPLGMLIGIVGPLPSEVLKRVEFLPFFIEGVLILLAPLLIFLFVYKCDLPQKAVFIRIFWWCLVPAILMLMVLHAPFGLLNPGSATRWRTNFEQIFYLAPLLLMYRFMDEAD